MDVEVSQYRNILVSREIFYIVNNAFYTCFLAKIITLDKFDQFIITATLISCGLSYIFNPYIVLFFFGIFKMYREGIFIRYVFQKIEKNSYAFFDV